MITYGNAPVPWTAMWSGEDKYFVGMCAAFGVLAICQREAPGEGKPNFGAPNVMRQRRAHAQGLCDLCAKPLKGTTRYSMSNVVGAVPNAILTHSEPLLHKECAKISYENCPTLRRQIKEGRFRIRKVFQSRARAAIATDEERRRFVPDYIGKPIAGLAVVDLLKWRDVTQEFTNAQH